MTITTPRGTSNETTIRFEDALEELGIDARVVGPDPNLNKLHIAGADGEEDEIREAFAEARRWREDYSIVISTHPFQSQFYGERTGAAFTTFLENLEEILIGKGYDALTQRCDEETTRIEITPEPDDVLRGFIRQEISGAWEAAYED